MSTLMMSEILTHSKTSASAQHLLLVLGSFARRDGTEAYPSMQTLAQRMGRSERHVQRLLKYLEAEGHIAVTRFKVPGQRPHNRYRVLRPWQDTAQTITDTMSVDPGKPEERKNLRAREDMPKKPSTLTAKADRWLVASGLTAPLFRGS